MKKQYRTIEELALAILRKDKEIEILKEQIELATEIIAEMRREKENEIIDCEGVEENEK